MHSVSPLFHPLTGSASRASSQHPGISVYHLRFFLGSYYLLSDSCSLSVWQWAWWDSFTSCLSLERDMTAGSERRVTSTGEKSFEDTLCVWLEMRLNLNGMHTRRQVNLFFLICVNLWILLVKRHLARLTDVEATDTSNPNLNYGLVVDCGSSGSRVFVYCWPRHNGNPHELLDIRQMRDQHRKPVVMKIKPGETCSWRFFMTHITLYKPL